MASSPCPHGMPTVGSCFECMEEGNLPPAPKTTAHYSAVFPAKYPGRCRVCGDEIQPGDLIGWDPDQGLYACHDCAKGAR